MIQKINLIIKLFIGFFIVILVVWNRIFRNRKGYDLVSLEIVSSLRILITTLLALLFIGLFLNIILKKLNISLTSTESIFSQIKFKIISYYYEILELTYEFVVMKIIPESWNIGDFLHKIGFTVYMKIFPKEILIKFIHLICVIFPRLIVCLSFCYSVFIIKNLGFFFSTLIFLVFPLSLILLKYALNHFSTTNQKELEEYLQIIEISPGKYDIQSKDKTNFDSKEQFNEYAHMWGDLGCIQNLVNRYDRLTQEFQFPFQLVMYFLYACSWSYLLYLFIPKASFWL